MVNTIEQATTLEVSLVPQGANRKVFILRKEDGDMKELLEKIMAAKISKEVEIDAFIKAQGMDQYAEMIKAMLRLLEASGMPEDVKAQLMTLMSDFGYMPAAAVKEAPVAPVVAPVAKESFMKEDGTPDFTKIPEAVRGEVEALYKEKTDSAAKVAVVEAEKLKIAKEADDAKQETIKKEFIAKAGELKHVPGVTAEDLGVVMKELSEKLPESFAKIDAILKASEAALAASELLKEKGSGGSGGGATAWERLQKSAESLSVTSKIDKNEAMAKVLETEEGRKLYQEYTQERAGK